MKISNLIAIYFTVVFVAFIMLKIYEKYTTKKLIFNKATILKIFLISILTFINNVFMFSVVRTLFSAILTFLLFKIIFKDSIKKTVYNTIIISITLYILELIMTLFIPLWINNVEVFNHSMLFKVGSSVIVNMILYLIITNKQVIRFFTKLESSLTNNKIYYLLCFIGIFTSNFWLFYVGIDTTDKILNFIICFTELVIIILLIVTIHDSYQKNISKVKEEQLKQNLNLYEKIASEHKELKHNLMNDLLIIKSKIAKKEQNFINDVINKYKSSYDWVNNITDIPEGLQGLVFLKKNQAELNNIIFNLEYNLDKNVEKYYEVNNNFKLFETLGILFDNAIEAAYESKEKIINVVFSYNEKNLKMSIYNTFNNEIDLDKIGNKNYSTKNRGSGIGLNYIKRQKNKFQINQSIQNNIFITDIIIKRKEKSSN